MNIVSVMASLSRKNGGIFESVRRLHQSLAEQFDEMKILVLGVRDEYTDKDLMVWPPLETRAFRVFGPRQFQYAPEMRRFLLGHADKDILHTHGIWQYPSIAVSAWHRKYRRPYMISPHGMLDPWAVRNSAWKKQLAWTFYERSHLEGAACIRALCDAEATAIREFGLRNPICVIPNGIDLPAEARGTDPGVENSPFHPFSQGAKILLYLGRIHPKKGLVNLLEAWRAVVASRSAPSTPWVLAIVGWDQGSHEQELRRLCRQRGIEGSVLFLGPKFDADKMACYRNCDAFILPSFSEGLPIVILEAWANGKPVLITPQCNLPEGFAAQAAVRIEPVEKSISAGLRQLMESSEAERQKMGQRGLALVKERFAWPKIAVEIGSVYEWMMGHAPKPECVKTV
jgi:poly(glycerol-phosphate) alpha-glucosyltransferase